MSTLTQPHTNGHDRELGDVRTYRGRKLEDLIPQIRAELGPDAIILRQREGLMGGVGGFFAQKCVEVDAQAGGGRESHRRVDIYDEDEPVNGWDEGLEGFVAPAAPELAPEVLDQTPALPAPEPPKPVAAEPIQPPFAEPIQPPVGERIAEPIQPPFAEPIQPPAEPAARWAQEADAFAAAPAQDIPAAPARAAEDLTAESFVSRLEQAAAHVDIDELVKLVTTGRVLANAAPAPAPVPAAPTPAPVPVPEAAAPLTPPSLDGDPVVPAAPEPIIQAPGVGGHPNPEVPVPETAPVPPAASPWVSKQASGPDANEAAAVVGELTAQGISESWAEQLIVAASAHRSPLAKGSLRDAVRATLAAIIPAP
ncbi:MAG: hypothetical protein ACLP4R_10935, partial [Solirubrobacteraceae bacterium]